MALLAFSGAKRTISPRWRRGLVYGFYYHSSLNTGYLHIHFCLAITSRWCAKTEEHGLIDKE